MTFNAVDYARKYQKEYRRKYPEKIREYKRKEYIKSARNRHLIKTYGICESEYELLLKKQNGKCAICGATSNTKAFHVDHDHKTGLVRGLLCAICNLQVVQVVEKYPERIEQAIKYLKEN